MKLLSLECMFYTSPPPQFFFLYFLLLLSSSMSLCLQSVSFLFLYSSNFFEWSCLVFLFRGFSAMLCQFFSCIRFWKSISFSNFFLCLGLDMTHRSWISGIESVYDRVFFECCSRFASSPDIHHRALQLSPEKEAHFLVSIHLRARKRSFLYSCHVCHCFCNHLCPNQTVLSFAIFLSSFSLSITLISLFWCFALLMRSIPMLQRLGLNIFVCLCIVRKSNRIFFGIQPFVI